MKPRHYALLAFLVLFGAVLAGEAYAVDYTTTGFNSYSLVDAADARFAGYRISVNLEGTLSMCAVRGHNALNAYIYNASAPFNLLANTTLVNGCANFAYTVVPGQIYYVVTGSAGANYNRNYTTTGVSYPYTGTGINITISGFSQNAHTGGRLWENFTGNAYNVQNITLSTIDITNLSIRATNNYTGAAISTFNASVQWNGSTINYTTTTGQINTTARVNTTLPANVTVTASGLFFTFTTTNLNSSSLNASVIPWANITARDRYDATTINNFTAVFNGTSYSTTTGSVQVPAQGTYNATITATNYFNTTLQNVLATSTQNATLFQAQVTFNATEIISGLAVQNFTVTAPNGINSNGSTPTLYLKAGTYNLTFNRTGWYTQNQTFTVTALTNTTQTFTDEFRHILNISVAAASNGTRENSFTATIRSGLYPSYSITVNATTGNVTLPWANDTNFNISITNAGFTADTSTLYSTSNFTNTPVLINVTVSAPQRNSFLITFFDETTGNRINTTTLTVIFTSTTFNYNYTTTNGWLNATGIQPATYTITYGGGAYANRQYTETLTNGSSISLSLYLLSTPQNVTFLVRDKGISTLLVENANIHQYRAVNGTWTLVDEVLTDITGSARMSYLVGNAYRFIVSATNYQNKTFVLNPVLYDSYTILLDRSTGITNTYDYSGVQWSINPTNFTNGVNNNVVFSIDAEGVSLTSYSISATYPGGSNTTTGVNPTGGNLNLGMSITGATVLDNVNFTVTYTTVEQGTRTFYRTYGIYVPTTNTTLNEICTEDYGLGSFDKAVVGTILIVVLALLGFFYVGGVGGGAGVLLGMYIAYKLCLFNVYAIAGAVIVGIALLVWRGGNQ